MTASSDLRALAARESTLLPGLIAREERLVRDAVEKLYQEFRSGRMVASIIGVDFRTLKRWLRKFEDAGYPIPETSKGEPTTEHQIMITIGRRTATLSVWARKYGMNRQTVNERIRRGWDPVKAVKTPAGVPLSQRKKPKKAAASG